MLNLLSIKFSRFARNDKKGIVTQSPGRGLRNALPVKKIFQI